MSGARMGGEAVCRARALAAVPERRRLPLAELALEARPPQNSRPSAAPRAGRRPAPSSGP
eukprot:scaffold80002_cov51-Phaeocystis_antarctica.AAC.2